MVDYVPDRGDIVWLDFSPQAGKEQHGRRPAVVLSHKTYNEATGLAVLVPITSQQKNYPFEVCLKETQTQGVILSDHIKNLDWRIRNVSFIEKTPEKILSQIKDLQECLIF